MRPAPVVVGVEGHMHQVGASWTPFIRVDRDGPGRGAPSSEVGASVSPPVPGPARRAEGPELGVKQFPDELSGRADRPDRGSAVRTRWRRRRRTWSQSWVSSTSWVTVFQLRLVATMPLKRAGLTARRRVWNGRGRPVRTDTAPCHRAGSLLGKVQVLSIEATRAGSGPGEERDVELLALQLRGREGAGVGDGREIPAGTHQAAARKPNGSRWPSPARRRAVDLVAPVVR